MSRLFTTWGGERAIQVEGGWTLWGAIGDLAGALGDVIAHAGVADGSAVAVVMRQRPCTLGAELAVLSLGRPSVLVSPLQGDRVLVDDLEATAPAVLVAHAADWRRPGVLGAVRAAGTLGVVVADDLSLTICVPSEAPPPGPIVDAAVTVQTSGTTGPPKRLPVSWETFVSLGSGAPGREARSDRGAIILSLPLITLGGLLSVSRLVFGGRPLAMMERFDVRAWAALVKEHRPATIGAPPPVVSMILDADISPDHFEGVTAYVTGSAPVPVEVARRFEGRYGIPVLGSYGATEFLGAVAGWTPALWSEFGSVKAGSAGQPLDGVRLRVLADDSLADPAPREVGPGEEGVLEVDPPRRAGHLPPGWLRTNDRVRVDADGFLWVLGRADDVIIRGGFKVDLRVVEHAIRGHPDVADAAVVALPDERLGSVPAALVVAAEGTSLTAAGVTEHVRALLPPYAAPARVMFTAAIPTTETLKAHRVAIQRLFAAAE